MNITDVSPAHKMLKTFLKSQFYYYRKYEWYDWSGEGPMRQDTWKRQYRVEEKYDGDEYDDDECKSYYTTIENICLERR